MRDVVKKPRLAAVIAGLCAVLATGASGSCGAAPARARESLPTPRPGAPALLRGAPGRSGWQGSEAGSAERTAAYRAGGPAAHRLDLGAPPAESGGLPVRASAAGASIEQVPRGLGAGAQRPPRIELQNPDYRALLPALGPDAHPVTVSPVVAMAQRLHHDGLPIARLWQNHSALLSLGLSPRGKPGLWLIQKTR